MDVSHEKHYQHKLESFKQFYTNYKKDYDDALAESDSLTEMKPTDKKLLSKCFKLKKDVAELESTTASSKMDDKNYERELEWTNLLDLVHELQKSIDATIKENG
jgi:hypothetical protein